MQIYHKEYSINKIGHNVMGGRESAYWIDVYFTRITPSWLNVDLIKRK